MNGTRSVILAVMLALGIFVLAGPTGARKLTNGVRATFGQPTKAPAPSDTGFQPDMLIGWAVLFLTFIVLTDIPATSELAVAFAWLLVLTIALAAGPDAIKTITTLMGQTSSPTPAPAAGGGGQVA